MTADRRTVLASIVAVDKQVMHGTPCFAGTRVPVQTLIDFLETGETVNGFLAAYPYVKREQVNTFLELGKDLAIEQITCVSS